MEADVLRWSLLVIGSVVIVGLAIHGIWVSRKNNDKKSGNTQTHKAKQHFESAQQQSIEALVEEDDFDELQINQHSFNVKKEPVVAEEDIHFDEYEPKVTTKPQSSDEEADINPEFDDLGLGAVRVVAAPAKTDANLSSEKPAYAQSKPTGTSAPEKVVKKSDSKIYASVVTQPKPEYAAKYQSLAAQTVAISQQEKVHSVKNHAVSKAAGSELGANATANQNFSANGSYQAPEPPPFLLKKQPSDQLDTQPLVTGSATMTEIIKQGDKASAPSSQQSTSAEPLAEKPSLGEQARNLVKRKKSESLKKRQEPKIAEDQMRIDFDDAPEPETVASPEQEIAKEKPQAKQAPQQEVLVLNVKVAEGESIAGAALLPMLLTLGFKFGEQDIFHRHVNSNGKGPVLFSLANMFKPGNFDIDNLENFTTQGISLFMILPIEGEPHQVFNMMHNAARKIADEFSGQIYDGRRALLTKQSLQQYIEKIREFERQRMLNR